MKPHHPLAFKYFHETTQLWTCWTKSLPQSVWSPSSFSSQSSQSCLALLATHCSRLGHLGPGSCQPAAPGWWQNIIIPVHVSSDFWKADIVRQTSLTCPHGARRGSQDRRQNYTWSSCTLLGSQTRARAMCRGGSASGVPLRRKYEVSRQGCASKCLKAFERQNPK